MTTKKQKYVDYRLQGYGTREAAERAGFSAGRPSPGARDLWKMVKMERGRDLQDRAAQLRSAVRQAEAEIRKLEARIDEQKQEKAWQARKLRAVLALIGAEKQAVG